MNSQVCLYFIVAATVIVLVAWRSGAGWFTDFSSERTSPAFGDSVALVEFSEHDEHSGFDAISSADPHFTVEGFKARVGEMFLALHEAAASGDLKSTQRFLDPYFYKTYLAQMEAQPAARNLSRVTAVRDVRPAIARHDDGLDLVRTTIVGELASGENLVEYWELVRRMGTASKPQMTIFKCPNCGAPIDGEDPSVCAYCDTRLADPALDWVVRKISVE